MKTDDTTNVGRHVRTNLACAHSLQVSLQIGVNDGVCYNAK